jgi:hypothetical protein
MAVVPELGVFSVGAESDAVTVAVYNTPPPGAATVSSANALSRARAFADLHGGLGSMQLQHSDLKDHGDAGTEFDFGWRAKSGAAWLPNSVSIGVYVDGSMASYSRVTIPVRISTAPVVSSSKAQEAALALTHGVAVASADLQVVTTPDGVKQSLVYIIDIRQRSSGLLSAPEEVWVDARTGVVADGPP